MLAKLAEYYRFANLAAAVFAAIAAGFSAYAATHSNTSGELVAAVNAISRFNDVEAINLRGQPCARMMVSTNNTNANLAALIMKRTFSFQADENNVEETRRCLDDMTKNAGNTVYVSPVKSKQIFEDIAIELNNYETLLLHWQLRNASEKMVCQHVLPEKRYFAPLIEAMSKLPDNDTDASKKARIMLDSYRAVQEFSAVTTCGN